MTLSGEPLEEGDCFKYLAADGGCEGNVYEGVFAPTALYRTEAWDMGSPERWKVNVREMKCLRSLVGVSLMD